jgi:hypothetical protein
VNDGPEGAAGPSGAEGSSANAAIEAIVPNISTAVPVTFPCFFMITALFEKIFGNRASLKVADEARSCTRSNQVRKTETCEDFTYKHV